MFKNILLAYDGSDHARKAAVLAGDFVRGQKCEAVLWIVTVMDPSPRDWGEPYLSQYIEQHTRDGQDMMQEAVALVGPEVDIRRELLFGSPARSILEVAETRECELIIIGTRGLGLLEGLLLGSQAQKVVSNAKCPVLIVK